MSAEPVRLHVEISGAGEPLVLLHGFTGSAASWADLVAALPGRRCMAVDLIGHGRASAPADPARYRMELAVADLAALLDELGAPCVDLLGYSLGGRVALQLAVAHPGRVRRLILESSTPGIAGEAERAARAAADDALAERIEREGLAAFVDDWERLPLFASQARLPAARRATLRAQRLRNRPHGLANALRGLSPGRQVPLWDKLGALAMPVLLICGELDAKYCAIAREMATLLPQASLVIVPGVGHTVHLEAPAAFARAVNDFVC